MLPNNMEAGEGLNRNDCVVAASLRFVASEPSFDLVDAHFLYCSGGPPDQRHRAADTTRQLCTARKVGGAKAQNKKATERNRMETEDGKHAAGWPQRCRLNLKGGAERHAGESAALAQGEV